MRDEANDQRRMKLGLNNPKHDRWAKRGSKNERYFPEENDAKEIWDRAEQLREKRLKALEDSHVENNPEEEPGHSKWNFFRTLCQNIKKSLKIFSRLWLSIRTKLRLIRRLMRWAFFWKLTSAQRTQDQSSESKAESSMRFERLFKRLGIGSKPK